MPFPLWFTVAGVVLVSMVLTGTVLKRLPLSSGLIYLAMGVGLGPLGIGLIRLDLVADAGLLERLAEVAVIVSLFAAGLKLKSPFLQGRWRAPVLLATVSMVVTIALVAAVGIWGLGLSVGAAVLLGAVLAPTDPVLASDVRVEHIRDRDRLRLSLTGEAGLNDGAAFPFVMLGLGLLGVHEVGPGFSRWLAVDVLWGVAGGLAVGAGLGWAVGRLVLYLRRRHREALGMDDFLALGLIALTYGVALHAHTYGFIAVFAAGLALRQTAHAQRVDADDAGAADQADARDARREDADHADGEGADAESAEAEGAHGGGEAVAAALVDPEGALEEAGADPETAPQVLVAVTLGVTEQLERAAEVALVLVVGALLFTPPLVTATLWFVPLLLLVIRPVAVYLGLWAAPVSGTQRALAAWFGVRGVGSVYYFAYALTHGLPEGQAPLLGGLMLWTVAASIVVHGVSVTPLMNWYQRRRGE